MLSVGKVRRGPLSVAAFGLWAAAVAACGDADVLLAAIGGDCVLDSDCEEGLACVFQRCHQECEVTPDCPLDGEGKNLHCMVGRKPDHYCQLSDETECTYSSECPGEQICGPDGRCRDECVTDKDCVTDQTCAQRNCALPDELDDNGKLPQTGTLTAGSYCEYTSECTPIDPDFVCRAGLCGFECRGDSDCATGVCTIAEGKEGGRCAASVVICVPGAQVACDCLGMTQGVQVCNAMGTGYDPCLDSAGMSCGAP